MSLYKEIFSVLIPIRWEVFSTPMKPKEIERNFDLRLNVLKWSKYVGGNSFKLQFEDSRPMSPKFIVTGSISPPRGFLGPNERKVSYTIFPSLTRFFMLLIFEGQFFYLGLFTQAWEGKVLFFSAFLLLYMLINRTYTKEFEGIRHTMSNVLTKGNCNHLSVNQFEKDKETSYERYSCITCGLKISRFEYEEIVE